MKTPVKVVVTGAAGQIGYALIFRIASGQMLGEDVPVELSLLEIESAMPSLGGVVMELQDCAFPLLKNISISSDPNVAMKGANWALLVGSMPRKEGMERSDLLKINGAIFSVQGKAINDHAADDVRTFVVGNPCNTNALIAMHHAPRVPRNRFFAMTLLDEARARSQIAIKAEVPNDAITQMAIWGNHSSTQFPDYANARIHGKPVTDVIHDQEWLQNTFIQTVQQRGATVIKARGASSAASAANAALMSVHHLVHDTPANEWFSVARCSEGEHDNIDPGLIVSMPCRVKGGQLEVVTGLTHDAFAAQKIALTVDELRKERDAVKELGLL